MVPVFQLRFARQQVVAFAPPERVMVFAGTAVYAFEARGGGDVVGLGTIRGREWDSPPPPPKKKNETTRPWLLNSLSPPSALSNPKPQPLRP